MTDFVYLFLHHPMFVLRYYLAVLQMKVRYGLDYLKDLQASLRNAGSLQG
ncbi:hypothetical protein LZK73_21925 [Neorhizobium galegae]|nr:hypothetical protein LZK73_21925 [Neorhizobium galegae]